jgi:hypothetical protein
VHSRQPIAIHRRAPSEAANHNPLITPTPLWLLILIGDDDASAGKANLSPVGAAARRLSQRARGSWSDFNFLQKFNRLASW